MKPLYPLVFLLFLGCAVDEIQMHETPLKLTKMEISQNKVHDELMLKWESLDGNIRIVTTAPVEDSNHYKVGIVYARCFLRR
jgi:hypothetical protein